MLRCDDAGGRVYRIAERQLGILRWSFGVKSSTHIFLANFFVLQQSVLVI